MAEVLLRHHLAQAGIDAAVSSAGRMAGGSPASPHAVTVVAERGLDLAQHRSRQVAVELVRDADLVIGMAREHVREAALLQPGALAKSFTLKELVRAAERHPRRPGEPVESWLGRLSAGRRSSDLLSATHHPNLDVADPRGGPRREYERTAAELDDLLARLVRAMFPAEVRL